MIWLSLHPTAKLSINMAFTPTQTLILSAFSGFGERSAEGWSYKRRPVPSG
jgi:hypothetical protein